MAQISTYSAQALAYIKECLLEGSLRPGDAVRENEIARELGISRGPVREALQTLLVEGLVTGQPQKAKFIRQMSAREIEESYCLGGTLEGACIVQSLPDWEEGDLQKTWLVVEEMRLQSATAPGLASMSQLDEAFHNSLMERCPNRLMVSTARNACSHISKFLYYREWDTLYTPGEFYQRHKIIHEAVSTRNPEIIQKTVLAHYAESGRRLGLACGK